MTGRRAAPRRPLQRAVRVLGRLTVDDWFWTVSLLLALATGVLLGWLFVSAPVAEPSPVPYVPCSATVTC